MDNHCKSNGKKSKPHPKSSKFAYWWKWPLTVLLISLTLSFVFSVLSQYALSGAGIAVSVVVIVVFIAISIIFDMIGVAVTAAQLQPFRAMASRKVRGAKESIKLINNAEKVASVCADIIGDICGILSGAAGSAVALIFISSTGGGFLSILIASLVSSIIAGLTIFGKAMFKKYAIKNCEKVVLVIGKLLSIFHIERKQKVKQQSNKETNKSEEIEEKKDND